MEDTEVTLPTGQTAPTTPTTPGLTRLAAPGVPACDGVPETFFTDVASCAGLQSALHIQDPLLGTLGNYVTGQTLGDFDGDPWLDLAVASPNGWTRIFLGSSTGVFTERALDGPWEVPSLSVTAADYDGDGDSDLLLTGYEGETLFENTGAALVEVLGGPSDPRTTMAAAWSDSDGDGWLELYAANYDCANCAPLGTTCDDLRDTFQAFDGVSWMDITNDVFGPFGNRLCGLGLVAFWWDADGDGDSDLHVGNDRGNDFVSDFSVPLSRNTQWTHDGSGVTEGALALGVGAYLNTMGGDFGDFDNDGDFDLALSDSGPTRLYRNDGGTFVDHSDEAGLGDWYGVITDGWAVTWLDYDNDGDLDLFTAATGQDRLERNDGGVFVDDTELGSGLHLENSRGATAADYDRDGRIDLVVGVSGGAYRLLRNTHPNANNWLGIRLIGAGAGGTEALGARVTVTDDSGRVQIREVSNGTSRAGGVAGLHFGLGTSQVTDVVVRWPDGVEEQIAPTANAWWEFSR